MSFPRNPTGGQQTQVNGIIYYWDATKTVWRRVVGTPLVADQAFNGNIIANSGAVSTSTTTGAIQVTRGGGIGVTGNVWANAFYSNSYNFANGKPISFNSQFTGNLTGGDSGQLVYQTAANTTSFLPTGEYGKLLTSNGLNTAPVWLSLSEIYIKLGQPFVSYLVYPNGALGASDSGNETVYVMGAGFQPGCSVSVNGNLITKTSFISTSNVAIVTNPEPIGGHVLTITNTNQQFYNYNSIEFIGAGSPYFKNPAGYLNFAPQTLFFSQALSVAGGYAPYNFSIVGGGLPTGMTLDSNTGIISGYAPPESYPTSFSFTVHVTDSHGQYAERTFYILVTVPLVLQNQITLSSRGSDFIRTSQATANTSQVHTITLSSRGSDFIRDSQATANTSIAHTLTLSSVGSDFIRDSQATANTSIAHTVTISANKYYR